MIWRLCIVLKVVLVLFSEIGSSVHRSCSVRNPWQGFAPHPNDCTKYKYCANGHWKEAKCEPNFSFDAKSQTCVSGFLDRCAITNSRNTLPADKSFQPANFNNVIWSLEPQVQQKRLPRGSKTHVKWVTHTLNGVITHVVIDYYQSDGESFRITKPGDLPKGVDIVQWVKENAHNYEKEPLEYVDSDTDAAPAATNPPPPPTYVTQPTRRPPRPPPRPVTKPTPRPRPKPTPPTSLLPVGEDEETLLPYRCGAGWLDQVDLKIINGTLAAIEENPWQVALLDLNSMMNICGGTIITKRHILTAAHCLYDTRYKTWRTASELMVRVGDFDTKRQDDNERDLHIKEFYRHLQYSKEHHRNDIALITVMEDMVFTAQVFPICLPEADEMTVGRKCVISGWGTTEKGKASRYLLSAKVPLVDQDVCRKMDPKVAAGMFCAGYVKEGGVDTCQGDSGGPLACQDNTRFYLYGITSWGNKCAQAGQPGVYTRVTVYRKWIINKLTRSRISLKSEASENVDEDII